MPSFLISFNIRLLRSFESQFSFFRRFTSCLNPFDGIFQDLINISAFRPTLSLTARMLEWTDVNCLLQAVINLYGFIHHDTKVRHSGRGAGVVDHEMNPG